MFDERGAYGVDYETQLTHPVEDKPRELPQNELVFTPKQNQFMAELEKPDVLYAVFGGAIQGGKSTCGISALFIFAKLYPGSRWAIVRRDLTTMRRNTLPSFNSIRPPTFVGEMRQSDWVARCANGSEIFFFPESVDTDPEYNRWKGLLVNGFLFEEMNECREQTFIKAIERAGTWRVKGEQPKPMILGTCNPARNFVYHRFYEPWRAGTIKPPYAFVQSLPGDNPHLAMQYVESLKNLPAAEYKRFVKGDWDVLDDPQQLISFEWLHAAARDVESKPGKKALGVDVARYGDDDSAIAYRDGNTLTKLEEPGKMSTTKFGEYVGSVIVKHSIDPKRVGVDVVGLGAGTVDTLEGNGFRITSLSAGGAGGTDGFFKFRNLRTRWWWRFREALRKGEVCFDLKDPDAQRRLNEELTAPRYRIVADKTVEVESKDDIKKRLGRSTDYADATIHAWAVDEAVVDYGVITLPGSDVPNRWRIA